MKYENYKQSLPEFHDIAGGTYRFVIVDNMWTARRAHAFMAMSRVWEHESKEALIKIIEEANSQ
jgi:hypothetical protein